MSYKPKVITVPEGGTGVASTTDYAVLCGGTSSTGAIQSIAGVGTSGQVLTSNGAGALPTFQNAPGGTFSILRWSGTANGTPADSTTYYVGAIQTMGTAQTDVDTWTFIPVACTLTGVYGVIECTAGSNQAVSMYVRVNNTTDVTITTTSTWDVASIPFSVTGLSTALAAGDYIQLKIVTPVWNPTNPLAVRIIANFVFSG